ncbi:exo 1,3/1,4-beta-D-glucan glucohydrolase [Lysobacter sp. SG-8]|uniref:Exo 1,3/1,4-beta-D-glucan glucohydrolase n=1 Tax=Marilutibacter penaei TaxID=2759900 RepID=A0A7W3U141_9GAMM|nr:glycoside hydrolase family 3 protein [Lysobacter penaei]MBB1086992.1 exo 1,3/1,4-beta-D-glucan glucohydrolase [Lysobacter penaei]
MRPLGLAVALSLACALVACSNAPGDDAPLAAEAAGEAGSPWPEVSWPLAEDPAIEARIQALLADMSVEEKVGQLIQGDISTITPDDVRTYHIGSVLAGGNSDPGGRYDASPADWLALADAFHEASMDTADGGHAIPVIFGIDAVHGQSNIVGATLFPHNIGLGATRDAELMRRIGRVTAIETRVTGMEWAFAPTVAVPQDDRWGRTYEGYSESPEVVAEFAPAVVEGLQGKVGDEDFLDDAHVIVSVKHFLGDGGTTAGKDQGDTAVDEATLARVHGAGYPPAIAAGAQSVMASFNSWNGEKMHGNRYLLTDVLKDRMQFGGFVVGDWNGHGQVQGCSNEDCPASINAGLDMPMAPDSWKGMYENTLAAVKSGGIATERLDDAVARILRVKMRLGLFEAGKPSERALGGKFELLGAPEHREVAREAVRESLVLLKNNGGVLPLSPKQRILVAGDGAHNMTKQAGGWTLNWQGTGTRREDFPNATTIFEGIRDQARAAGGEAVLSVDGHYEARPDVAVVVFGEDPYAEFQGDIPNLLYRNGDTTDLDLLKRLKADGIPVVSVFISGRPLWVNREINASDAFVAAWLPGSEGEGVADVLLRDAGGEVQHDFEGTLSFSWPRTAVQYANNVGQEGYDPQFAFGHGLTYASPEELAPLPEEAGVDAGGGQRGLWFARGTPALGVMHAFEGTDGGQQSIHDLPAALPDGSLRMTAVDHGAQESARRIEWAGAGAWRLELNTPTDISRESNGDLTLQFEARVDDSPEGEATLGIGCGDGCGGEVAIGNLLRSLPGGEWTTLAVPLECLATAGADMTKVAMPARLASDGPMVLSVAKVSLESANAAAHTLDCTR